VSEDESDFIRRSLRGQQKEDVEISAPVTAVIDDTNDLGSRKHGKHYILGATAVDADKVEAFADLTKKYNLDKEIKFISEQKLRKEVLEGISELEPRIYAVTVRKPRFHKWDKTTQKDVHRNALQKLMKKVAEGEGAPRIHMIIDESSKAKAGTVDRIRNEVADKRKKELTLEIMSSANSSELQSNDFSVGAMNKKYNQGDSSFADILPDIDRSRLICKTKPNRGERGKKV